MKGGQRALMLDGDNVLVLSDKELHRVGIVTQQCI